MVKVQLSLYTNDNKRRMLVYNEDRSIKWEEIATEEVIIAMEGKNKRFFEAELDKDNRINLIKPVKEQCW